MKRLDLSDRVVRTIGVFAAGWMMLGASEAVCGNEFVVSHTASGQGTARVFDGGPARSASGRTSSPDDLRMSFLAADDTRPGSLGAGASVWGLSEIIHVDPGFMRIIVNFSTGYYPSDFPSGDRPGGSAEGEMSSSVAFEMPADEIGWYYQLEIDDLPGFEGSSSVTVWNETQSVTLLHLTSERWFVETTLAGNTGDLIRVTSVMSGSGSGPPGLASYRHYLADLRMDFWIPEPSSLTLLCGGVLILTRRRSSVRCGRAFPGSASARRIGSAP